MNKISIKDTLSTDINSLPGEVWDFIPGYGERYMISNYSRVKSIIFKTHVIIKKTLSNGRYKVIISSKKGIRKNENCGRLCARVFLRPPEENEVIKYKNNNVLFDASENLEWISKSGSVRIAYANGRFPQGHGKLQRNGMLKLTPIDVMSIRRQKDLGVNISVLAKKYNVSFDYIGRIANVTRRKNLI